MREVLPQDASDTTVLQFAQGSGGLLVTCNRDDFVRLATQGRITALSSLSDAGLVPPSGPLCFVWNARERRV